jgi:hypothetical protein
MIGNKSKEKMSKQNADHVSSKNELLIFCSILNNVRYKKREYYGNKKYYIYIYQRCRIILSFPERIVSNFR